jgi:hypothetical protein
MSTLSLSLLICAASMVAGFLGALTGLGGGVVIVPVHCLLFKIGLHYAIGASLVSVIATSSGSAAAVELLVHCEDGVDGAFLRSRHVTRYILSAEHDLLIHSFCG